MTRADLLALAERAERAEGPDRELDAEIGAAIRWHPVGCEDWLKEHETFAARGTHIHAGELKWPAPRFTASLDAALLEALKHRLVAALGCIAADGLPGCCLCVSTDPVREVWGVSTGGGDDQIGRLARAAIAAALRARAAKGEG